MSVKVEVKPESLAGPESLTPQTKRKGPKKDIGEESPRKKSRVVKRGYADPDTYAHLDPLSDHLAPYLDVVFCGINPGCMSATKGHHFANPTNHFWKALHLSGLTPRRLFPSEDATLPAMHNLGLTNLVERPSAEQAELSKEEMKLSVPTLKEKVARYRPRIVCFVGKGIWLIVEAAFKKQALRGGTGPEKNNDLMGGVKTLDDDEFDPQGKPVTPPPTPRKTPSRRAQTMGKRKATSESFEWGLQPYKFVYPELDEVIVKKEEPVVERFQADFSMALATELSAPVKETLFFVMPSTSGRVVSHQLLDKVKLFASLRNDLEGIKTRTLDTASMTTVPFS